MAKEEGFLLLLSPSLRWAASGSSQFPSLGLMGTDLSFRAQQKWGCDVGRNSSSASSRSCELCRACWVCGPVPHKHTRARLSRGEGEGSLGPGYSQAFRQGPDIPWRCMGTGSEA